MPTINCALNSSPLEECKDSRPAFIIILVILWTIVTAIFIARLKSHFHRGRGKHFHRQRSRDA